MPFCDKCDEWFFSSSQHSCPPIWVVWSPENDESVDDGSMKVRARDAESAAELWAEREDRESAEYSIVGGKSTPTVCVVLASEPSAEPTRWFVEGESVPSYSATQIGEK